MTIEFRGDPAALRAARISGRDAFVNQPGARPAASPVSPEALLESSRTARAAAGTTLARPAAGEVDTAIAAATLPPAGTGQSTVAAKADGARSGPHRTDRSQPHQRPSLGQ